MNGDAFWFSALPNAALIATVAAVIYRLAVRPIPATVISTTDRPATLWGRIPFQWGLIGVLGGHLLALLVPGSITAWNGAPVRLYLLEASGLALALWALVGLGVMLGAAARSGIGRPTLPDVAVVVGVAFLIGSGILLALGYRWGSSWGTAVLVPYLWSVPTGTADAAVVGDLPWLAQAHFVSFFAVLVVFPLSRWWGLVVAGWEKAVATVTVSRSGSRPAGVAAGAMTWGAAYARAGVILVAATLMTVWLPSRITQALSGSNRTLQDLAGSGVWVVMLGALLYGLRWAQRSGKI